MIEPTDEMVAAFEREGTGGYGDVVDVRRGLAAAFALLARRIEGKRGEDLCDCDFADDDPISPETGKPMDHHCDCTAVLTVAVVLGSASLTSHHAECVCGRSTP